MTASHLPPGRPGDARWKAPGRRADSPEQDSLRTNARSMVWLAVTFAALLVAMAITFLTIGAIREDTHPAVHRARGLVDVVKPSRRSPLFRLSRPGAEPLQFKCLNEVIASPRCPVASRDWTPREMTVEWIDVPTLPRLVGARVTRMAVADDPLFAASPRAVLDGEIANLRSGLPGLGRILGGMMIVSAAVAAYLFGRLSFVTRQIEEANRQAGA
jgi:hypothetical protein